MFCRHERDKHLLPLKLASKGNLYNPNPKPNPNPNPNPDPNSNPNPNLTSKAENALRALDRMAGRKVAYAFLKDTAPKAVDMRTVLESKNFKTAQDFITMTKSVAKKV